MNRPILSISSLFVLAALLGSACGDGEADVIGPALLGDGDGDGNGHLECDLPRTMCDGICTSTAIDPKSCGDCGRSCNTGEGCLDGVCTDFGCPTGQVSCDNKCVDLMENFAHCGGCGDACDAGEVCDDGQCEPACPPSFLLCDGNCIDPLKDRAYCGATSCDDMGHGGAGGAENSTVCAEGEVCFDGACALSCPMDLLACEGTCVDPSTDPTHCGATDCDSSVTSGVTCDQGESCVDGGCKKFQFSWGVGTPVNGNGTTTAAMGHLVKADDAGNAIALWGQQSGSVFQVYGSYFSNSTKSWTSPSRIDASVESVRDLSLDVAPSGQAAAAWTEGEVGTDSIIVVRRFEPSTRTWLGGVRVDSSSGTSEAPTIGVADSGDIVVSWSQKTDGGDFRIARNHFDAGSQSWSGETLFFAYGEEDPSKSPRLDANGAGDAALIWWEGTDAGPYVARASVYEAENESWSAPALLKVGAAPSQALSIEAGSPDIGIDASGNAYAVWSQLSSGSQDIWASKFTDSWSTPQVIEAEANMVACVRPRIATAGSGSSIVVFEVGSDPGPFDVHASFLDSSLSFDDDTIASGVASSTSVNAAIVGEDVSHVLWIDAGNVRWAIRDGIGSWSNPIGLTTSGTPAAMDPVLAGSVSGHVFAGWSQGGSYFLARFD